MADDDLKFHFPVDTLTYAAGRIQAAGLKYSAQLTKRFSKERLDGIDTLLGQVKGGQTDQKSAGGAVGTLTREQNDALDQLLAAMARAKKVAKDAFPKDNEHAMICSGYVATIQVRLGGDGPWAVAWSDGVATNYTYDGSIRPVSPPVTTTYTITSVAGRYCANGIASGSAIVTVNTNMSTTSVVVSNEVLIMYNSNVADSVSNKDYYVSHRPGFSDANALGCTCTTTGTDGFESITTANLTNQIINPIINFIQTHPSKSIHYVVLMYGMPSRVDDTSCSQVTLQPPSVQHHISRCMADAGYTSGAYYEGANCGFVATNYPVTTCLVTAFNMATLADAEAYIDKLTSMYTGNVIISAMAAGYHDTNYYLDETAAGFNPALGSFTNAILAQNSSASIIYSSNSIITNGSDVRGYVGWGYNSGYLSSTYPVDGSVAWSGDSTWWIVETLESFNGQRCCGYQGCVKQWFASNAWGGTNYSNTPVGGVSHVQEPYLTGVNGPAYMSMWEAGYLFSECAWASKNTSVFQAIGDPLVKQ